MLRELQSMQKGPWSTDLEPRIVDTVPMFKLRGSRLVDAEPVLLGLADAFGSRGGVLNWFGSQHLEFCFKQSQ